MAELTKKGEERRVLFFHVPVESDDVAIEKGLEIMIQLIRAVVRSGKMKKLLCQ
jgi:pyroglutamyl-peptidase